MIRIPARPVGAALVTVPPMWTLEDRAKLMSVTLVVERGTLVAPARVADSDVPA